MIEQLIKDKKYKKITNNVCHNSHLADDLHQEAILIIIEKKINFAEIRNLEHFFAAVVWRTWHSNKFKKKYINKNIDFWEWLDYEVEDESIEEIDFTVAYNFIDKNPKTEFEYYEINLFKIYLELGSLQKVARKTKIPYQTIFYDIKQIKDKLKLEHDKTRNKM